MIDCSKEILAYHNKKVNLSGESMKSMRSRRESIHSQLKKGLELKRLPKPRMIRTQGSFAMKTMIQNDRNDYDIDDGVYFDAKALNKASPNNEMTPRQARRMVQCAIIYKNPSTKCEVRGKCVRVRYQKGCHIDMPVYRLVRSKKSKDPKLVSEIAIDKEWKRSDAVDVTRWFKEKNKSRSPDTSGDGQMRRIVRLMKKFSKSHENWNEKMLGRFVITVLVAGCYKPNEKREDKALYNTMKAMQVRLNRSLDIKHPITVGELIIDGAKGAKARFFLRRLNIAIKNLAPLLRSNCTRSDALECWGKVFGEDFLGRRNQNKVKSGKRR